MHVNSAVHQASLRHIYSVGSFTREQDTFTVMFRTNSKPEKSRETYRVTANTHTQPGHNRSTARPVLPQ
jgi:hypothetical protein